MSTKTTACALRKRKTKFIEIFRTTPPKNVCPNFYVLAHANGCPFTPQCSYCYLKSSFWSQKGPVAFNNVDKIFREARRWIAKDGLESYVLNLGNLSDSLAFEKKRPFIAPFVELFRTDAEAKGRPHCALLVTKGGMAECATLFKIKPCANIIISFSVNHPDAARRFEAGAAPAADRFRAAARLKKLGWRVRIRIDPMIKGYDYAAVLRQTRALRPERVTLGMLRAERNLPRRAPKGLFSELVLPELKKDLARYPLPLRLTYYRKAIKALKDICPIALCEEHKTVWDALGLDTDGKRCNCTI